MSKQTENYLVGLSGWRRKCLLFTLTLLLIVVVINLVMTLWMIKVLHFSANGMGPLKIIPGGIQIRREALVLDKLVATKFSSRKGQPIQVESSKNLTLFSAGSEDRVYSKLFLGEDRFEMSAPSVKVWSPQGHLLFGTDKREVTLGADVVRISTEGGTVIHGNLQTPLVRPEAGQNLRLESPTKQVKVSALHGVHIESRAGDITAQSLGEFKLQSKTGSITLDAPTILFPKMPTASTRPKVSPGSTGGSKPEVFQVCICSKGRLFLAPPAGPCAADNDVCR